MLRDAGAARHSGAADMARYDTFMMFFVDRYAYDTPTPHAPTPLRRYGAQRHITCRHAFHYDAATLRHYAAIAICYAALMLMR